MVRPQHSVTSASNQAQACGSFRGSSQPYGSSSKVAACLMHSRPEKGAPKLHPARAPSPPKSRLGSHNQGYDPPTVGLTQRTSSFDCLCRIVAQVLWVCEQVCPVMATAKMDRNVHASCREDVKFRGGDEPPSILADMHNQRRPHLRKTGRSRRQYACMPADPQRRQLEQKVPRVGERSDPSEPAHRNPLRTENGCIKGGNRLPYRTAIVGLLAVLLELHLSERARPPGWGDL